jgi:hypothetical protein
LPTANRRRNNGSHGSKNARRRTEPNRNETKRNAKQTVNPRHAMLAEVLGRVKAPLGTEALRFVARFVLGSLSHDLACRHAKRHGLQPSKNAHDWELAEKARSLYKAADGTVLASLIFEAMLLAVAPVAQKRRRTC